MGPEGAFAPSAPQKVMPLTKNSTFGVTFEVENLGSIKQYHHCNNMVQNP